MAGRPSCLPSLGQAVRSGQAASPPAVGLAFIRKLGGANRHRAWNALHLRWHPIIVERIYIDVPSEAF